MNDVKIGYVVLYVK